MDKKTALPKSNDPMISLLLLLFCSLLLIPSAGFAVKALDNLSGDGFPGRLLSLSTVPISGELSAAKTRRYRWVEYQNHVYGYRKNAVMIDRYGATANLTRKKIEYLSRIAEMVDVAYLQSQNRPSLQALQEESINKVKRYNVVIQGLAKLQDKLIQAGVLGTAAYFGKADTAWNILTQAAVDELTDTILKSPTTVAMQWGRVMVSAASDRLDRLIDFSTRMEQQHLGTNPSVPFSANEVEARYRDAVWVDVYALPAIQLIRATQISTDASGQFKRLGNVAGGSAMGIGLKGKIKTAVEGLMKARAVSEALSVSLPAYKDYVGKVDARLEHWKNSRIKLVEKKQGFPPASQGAPGATVIVIIDTSGSMEQTDPKGLRRAAVKLISAMARDQTQIGLVQFSANANILLSPVVMGTYASKARNKLRTMAASLNADGGTDISKALKTAVGLASHNVNNGKTTFLLLTDGQDQNWAGDSRGIPPQVQVHTIALSDAADRASLEKLSKATHGTADIARTAADLRRIFANLFSHAEGDEMFLQAEKIMLPGGIETFTFPIELGVAYTQFMVTWPGSNIDLEVTAPDGTTLATVQAVASGQGVKGDTFKIIRIKNPTPGLWAVKVKGIDIAAQGEAFTVRATGKSSSKNNPVTIDLPEIYANDAFQVKIQGDPIHWTQADLLVWEPGGELAIKMPTDINQSGDLNIPYLKKAGLYRLQLTLWGTNTDSAAPLTRVIDRTIEVLSPRPKPEPKRKRKKEPTLNTMIRAGAPTVTTKQPHRNKTADQDIRW